MRKIICGPWLGEFGWEIMAWIPALRRYKKDNPDVEMTVVDAEGSQYLYEDFADDFIGYGREGKRDRWLCNGNKPSLSPDTLVGFDAHIKPNKTVCCDWKRSYKRYGFAPDPMSDNGVGYNILIHARRINQNDHIDRKNGGSRNWPRESYEAVVKHFSGLPCIASIGTRSGAHHIKGTTDLRGIPLQELCERMSESHIIIGPSSGPMHLAALCGLRQIVWTDDKWQHSIGGTNRDRYERKWNPFETPVTVIDKYGWFPKPKTVIKEIEKCI